jgi:hypothetical protein
MHFVKWLDGVKVMSFRKLDEAKKCKSKLK